MDRFTLISSFVAVVEQGSFTGAARTLNLSKATVSAHVAELERTLGSRLLNRNTRVVHPTEAGEDYHRRVVEILESLKVADSLVTATGRGIAGRLRVTGPMSFGLLKITSLIPTFLERHPALQLDLKLDDRSLDLIDEGFDMAIRGRGALPDSSLHARRLADLPLVLCASPAYLEQNGSPAEPSALMHHRCLLYTNSDRPDRWSLSRDGQSERVLVRGHYAVNNSLAIRQALLAGSGIASIPRIYVEDDLVTGQLVEVLDRWTIKPQAVYALYPSGAQPSPAVRAFIDFLVDALGRETVTACK